MKRITVIAEASEDLLEILTWYRGQSSVACNRFYAEFQGMLLRIQARPKIYAKRDALLRRANFHRFPYYLLYHELESTIEVIAVAHASRAPIRWQERMPQL